MGVMRLSGRSYDERPPSKGVRDSRVRRLTLLVESLNFAAESCTELERRLYKSIREVQAHAENLRDQVKAESLGDPCQLDLMSAGHEP
jgi:hypothetical protein